MAVLGIIGFPLGHSFSKGYFTQKFERLGMEGYSYQNYPIENIHELPSIINGQLLGFNVTIPYKQQVMPFLDHIDPTAQAVGAVNCVKVEPIDGFVGKCINGYKLTGYNSDIYGLGISIRQMIASRQEPLSALVLGSGGASKAAEYLLNELEIPYKVVSRTAGEGVITYADLSAEIMSTHKLIINSTPLGMSPKVDTAPDIPYDAIESDHILFDMVYNPAQTLFLERGRVRGAMVRSGYNMLVGQAERWFEILFNK